MGAAGLALIAQQAFAGRAVSADSQRRLRHGAKQRFPLWPPGRYVAATAAPQALTPQCHCIQTAAQLDKQRLVLAHLQGTRGIPLLQVQASSPTESAQPTDRGCGCPA